MQLKLTLEYDGTGFRGWARQPGLRTVEGAVRDAFDAVFPSWSGLGVAGRTDAGVHASGQVVSVTVQSGPPLAHVARALSSALPGDVAVLGAEEVDADFHARFSARSRRYRYRIVASKARSALDARRSLWWPRPVSFDALTAAAALLHGEHDFRAFTPSETQHVSFSRNVLAAAWEQDGDRLDFTVEADSFLRHMVRTLVGTMLEAGEDAEERMRHLLGGRPRADAGLTAPPWGLCLERVRY